MTKFQGWFISVALTLIAMSVSDTIGTKVIAIILYCVAWIGFWWHALDELEKKFS